MLSVAVCLLATLQGAHQVDFEVRATTLSNALGKLSRQVGKSYLPSKELAGEVVCIKVQRVPLKELESRLAHALDAEWTVDQGEARLVRTPQRIADLRRAEFDARVKWLESLFASKAKELARIKGPNDQAEGFLRAVKSLEDKMAAPSGGVSMDGPRLAAPSSNLANALAIDLGAAEIAALPADQAQVYSSFPTKAQRALGKSAASLIREYALAESRLGDLLPEKEPKATGGILDDVYVRQSDSDQIGKVLLTVSPRGRIVSFNSHIFSKSGKLRTWGLAGTYYMGDDPFTRERVAGAGDAPAMARLSEGSIALDQVAEFSLDRPLWLEEGPSKPWSETTETQRKILLNPETIDPLSLHVTDACFNIASRSQKNFIAYLSDDMVRAGRMATKDESIDLARFQAIAKANGTTFQSSDGWLEIKPASVLSATERRMPRGPLGKFLREVVATGATELESLSRLHFESGNRASGRVIVRMYRHALKTRGFPGLGVEESHIPEVYCTLGSLSANQWRTLRQGGDILLGRMPSSQRNTAAAWMYCTPYLQTDPAANVSDLFRQPTEFAPLGLPANAILSGSRVEKLVLRNIHKITYPDGSVKEGSMDSTGKTADEITRGYARGGYYKSLEHFASSIRNAKFEYAMRRDETFRLQILPTHWIEETFLGGPRDVQVADFDKLPEQIRDEILQAFERNFRDRGDGGGLDKRTAR